MQRLLIRAFVACLLSAGLAACSTGGAPCSQGPLPTVRIAHANPAAPDPPPQRAGYSMGLTDSRFLRTDASGRPVPALVQSWHTTDRRTWTITLQPNLRSHDGQPLTADHLRTVVLARLASAGRSFTVWSEIQQIDAPTPTTLVFRLSRPSSVFLEALANMGVAQMPETPSLSTGAFRLVRDTPTRLEFAAFPAFWGGTPRVAGVRMDLYPSARAAWAAFLRNEADFLYDVPPAAIPFLAQNPVIRVYRLQPWQLYVLGFQVQSPLLRDVRVRQALNLALDREALVRGVFPDYANMPEYGKLATAPFSPGYWAVQDAGPPWPYDPAAARALLAAANHGRTEPIEITCLTTNQFQPAADIAANLESQLQRVHVRLRIVPLPWQELYARLEKGDFETFVLPMTVSSGGSYWPHFFWSSGVPRSPLRSGYTSADTALDALYHAPSPEAERAAAHAVVETMRRDPPAVFLMPSPFVVAVQRDWVVPEDAVDIRRSLHQWTLKGFTPCGPS
jgi:ABC-type transport system substrate-binding protein